MILIFWEEEFSLFLDLGEIYISGYLGDYDLDLLCDDIVYLESITTLNPYLVEFTTVLGILFDYIVRRSLWLFSLTFFKALIAFYFNV